MEKAKTELIQDTLQNGYKILQNKNGFKFGIDAFLLSWFCRDGIRNGNSVIDLCTGNGIIPLLLESSSRAFHISALEIQEDSAKMAQESVKINNLFKKIEIVNGDIKNVQNYFTKHSFQVVTCNPPYMASGHGKQNPADSKSIARFEVLCNLENVVQAADYLLKPNGVFFLIHRPFRLAEIFRSLSNHNIEPKRLQFVQPHKNEEPNLVLIEARKNANPRLKIEPSLTVYNSNGEYTDEIKSIYSSFKRVTN